MLGSCINVSQKNNLVIIKINENAKIQDIIPQIKKKVYQLKKIYKGEKTPIKIIGKVLKNKEIDEIEEIIKQVLDVGVEFDMPKEMGLHNIKKTFSQEVSTSETKFHRGSLRSGQKLEDEGSLVIIGDVNSGAEVIAADNIVVTGALIVAGKLDSVQIRIANIVKEIDRDEEPLHKEAYVCINNNQIVIE